MFSACMLPALTAWSIWVRFHQTPTEDFALLYYLDYVKFGLVNQEWSNIHRFLWIKGFSEFQSLGKFMIVGVPNHPFVVGGRRGRERAHDRRHCSADPAAGTLGLRSFRPHPRTAPPGMALSA